MPSTESTTTNTTEEPLLLLPSEEDRCRMRQCVMIAAASCYISRAVKLSEEFDEEEMEHPDDNTKQRKAQQQLHERYKQRLRDVFGEKLLTSISSCLLLPPNTNASQEHEHEREDVQGQTPNQAFQCVALLLCNHVLSFYGEGSDARIRYVIQVASVHVLAEHYYYLEREEAANPVMRNHAIQPNEVDRDRDRDRERGRDRDISPSTSRFKTKVKVKEDQSLETLSNYSETSSVGKLSDYLEDADNSNSNSNSNNNNETVEQGAASNSKKRPPRRTPEHHSQLQNRYRCLATKQFVAMEQAIARIIMISTLLTATAAAAATKQETEEASSAATAAKESNKSKKSNEEDSSLFSKTNMVRGLKIGSVGVAAGALFAVTGGMAAPGIAAGLAALGVGSTVALATTPAALITLFGVGGGGLSAYKMKRRTDGLQEFNISRESCDTTNDNNKSEDQRADLHATVCVSGWLHDEQDFQRPWGITPTGISKLEVLQRFYSVHDPDKVEDCKDILEFYKDKEDELWDSLKEQYGRDPDHLLPLEDNDKPTLSESERKSLIDLLECLVRIKDATTEKSDKKSEASQTTGSSDNTSEASQKTEKNDKSEASQKTEKNDKREASQTTEKNDKREASQTTEKNDKSEASQTKANPELEKPTLSSGSSESNSEQRGIEKQCSLKASTKMQPSLTVWDCQTKYGGDMYTVRWESELLVSMCDVVNNMIKQVASKATEEVLKKTALATIMAAVAWPALLMDAASTIDSQWTLVTI